MFEINCYNYKRCMGLNCELLTSSLDSIENGQFFSSDANESHHFYFILYGEATVNMNNSVFKVSENDLVFVAPDKKFEMSAISDEVRFLHIAFNIYTLQSSGYDDETSILTNSYIRCQMATKEITGIARYNSLHTMLYQIVNEIKWQHKMYISVIKSQLNQLVIMLLRVEGIMPSPIEHINSIALWSGPEGNFEIPEGTELYVSNIEFCSGVDTSENDEKILGIISPQRYYIENERSMDKVICCTADEVKLEGKATQMISSSVKTNFKVWFFLERAAKDMNLRPFINSGYVKFYIRSNKSFSFVFSMYHHATYSCISSIMNVSENNEWQEFRIPFSSENGKVAVSDYIESVLVYIRENYTNKITLDDLCNYVHLQKAYLCTLFKNHMQMSIGEYIRLYRVNIAKNLLLETKHKAEEIAVLSGFYDVHHFSRTFKHIVGINPSEFRSNKNSMADLNRENKKNEKI